MSPWQGDPLSLYFFMTCAEGLFALICNFENKGLIHGCRVVMGAPIISHLFFVDDFFFFFRATVEECTMVKSCFTLYESTSGQKINFQKSSITFNSNTFDQSHDGICSLLEVAGVKDHGHYLGLSSVIRQNKKEVFENIRDGVWQKYIVGGINFYPKLVRRFL